MKRLLRKWLKRQVIKRTHVPIEPAFFEWIYDSPISTWKDILFCLKHVKYYDEAKYVYDWLSNDSFKSVNDR